MQNRILPRPNGEDLTPLTRRDLVMVKQDMQRDLDKKFSELSSSFASSLQVSVEGALKSVLSGSLPQANQVATEPRSPPQQDEGHTADNEMDVDDDLSEARLPKNHCPRGKKSKEEKEFQVSSLSSTATLLPTHNPRAAFACMHLS